MTFLGLPRLGGKFLKDLEGFLLPPEQREAAFRAGGLGWSSLSLGWIDLSTPQD